MLSYSASVPSPLLGFYRSPQKLLHKVKKTLPPKAKSYHRFPGRSKIESDLFCTDISYEDIFIGIQVFESFFLLSYKQEHQQAVGLALRGEQQPSRQFSMECLRPYNFLCPRG